jgi:hypothetical protein
VHSGNIAAFYEDEKIRVRDWNVRDPSKHLFIDAYVVQCAAMPGASGSPVFVRETEQAAGSRHFHPQTPADKDDYDVTTGEPKYRTFESDLPTAYGELYLLGLWHGSWEVDGVAIGAGPAIVRNPAGYGIVVPAEKILEVLDMPKLKQPRDEAMKKMEAQRAKSLPVADSLPRPEAQQRFDSTLKRMLDTPPKPKQQT